MLTTKRTLNFCPKGNYTLAATTASQNTVVTQGALNEGAQWTDLCISNNTSAVAFINWSRTTATAAIATSFAVLPGETVVLNMGFAATNIAIILGTGTGNVYFSVGVGG